MRKIFLNLNSLGDFERIYLYDLPKGGIFFQTTDEYSLGEMVLLVIQSPELPDGILLKGRVAWRRLPTKWSSALQPGIGVSLDEAEPQKLFFLINLAAGRLEDRRGKSRRIPVSFKVNFSNEKGWHEGTATNISREGLFIKTDADIQQGETLILELYLNGDNSPGQYYGRVIRRCCDNHYKGIGVELEYKTPLKRREVYNFIEREEARLLEKI